MAKIGAARPMWAPITAESAEALPAYGENIDIGTLVSANVTTNFANGQDHGDNRLVEEVNEFISATCAMENNDTTLTVESKIYGSKLATTGGELTDAPEDSAPYGGLTYFQSIIRNGVKKFRACYYPKVKAALGPDNAQTKAGSVAFQHTQTTFTIFAPLFGGWRIRQEFDAEEAAVAWMKGKLAPIAPEPEG